MFFPVNRAFLRSPPASGTPPLPRRGCRIKLPVFRQFDPAPPRIRPATPFSEVARSRAGVAEQPLTSNNQAGSRVSNASPSGPGEARREAVALTPPGDGLVAVTAEQTRARPRTVPRRPRSASRQETRRQAR